MSRIHFINRFYWPETPATGQLLTDLAESLAANGHDVTVITSRPNRSTPAAETRRGVKIVRVRTARWAPRSILGKAAAFAGYWCGAAWRIVRLVRRHDLVVVLTDPPLFGVPVAVLATLKSARLVHWAQDIYPEVAVALTGQRWLQLLAPLRNAAWRTAERCVTLGPEMRTLLLRAGVPPANAVIIPNWAPHGIEPLAKNAPAVLALRKEWGLRDEFVVGYSGNLGRVHDLAPVIAAAALLRDNPKVVFAFVGGGPQQKALAAQAAASGLKNVRFFPYQPREQLATSLAVPDVHLVTLRPGCQHVVYPSKFYGIAAAGRPVLFVGPADCELAEIVRTRNLGVAVDRDPAKLAAAITRLAASPAELASFGQAALAFGGPAHTHASLTAWAGLLGDLEACGTTLPATSPRLAR